MTDPSGNNDPPAANSSAWPSARAFVDSIESAGKTIYKRDVPALTMETAAVVGFQGLISYLNSQQVPPVEGMIWQAVGAMAGTVALDVIKTRSAIMASNSSSSSSSDKSVIYKWKKSTMQMVEDSSAIVIGQWVVGNLRFGRVPSLDQLSLFPLALSFATTFAALSVVDVVQENRQDDTFMPLQR